MRRSIDGNREGTGAGMAARGSGRLVASFAAAVAVVVGLLVLVLVSGASAFDPANFGLSEINDGDGPAQEAPAIPDARNAFWAGTCERASAPLPPPFAPATDPPPTPIPGGVGGIPSYVWSPHGESVPHARVRAPAVPTHCMEWGSPAPLNVVGPWTQPPRWRLPAHTQAGGHPDGTTMFALDRSVGDTAIDGSLDNIVVDLPPGLVGDPNAVPKCTAEQFRERPLRCPPETQLGVLHLEINAAPFSGNVRSGSERIYPVYNVEPRQGNVAELGFGYASGEDAVNVRIVAKARTNSDFGVTAFVGQIPAALQVRSQQITIWGVPWAASNDIWRAPTDLQPGNSNAGCNFQPGLSSPTGLYLPPSGLTAPGCAQGYDPSWGPIKPFFSNLTECTGQGLSTRLSIDQFQQPGPYTSEGDPLLPPFPALPAAGTSNWRSYSSPAPAMTGCEKAPFDANLTLAPTTSAADSPSGLSVDLATPQNSGPGAPPPAGASDSEVDAYVTAAANHWRSDAGLATSHLDTSVVELPEGFSVNPSAAAGLDACSDAGIGLREAGNPPLFNNGDPFDTDPSDGAECPQSSIIGEVTVDVPLLEQPLVGKVVLGAPKSTDPQSGEMFRMFLVVKDDERGLIAKIYGTAVADPATGKLTATFERNPRVPFEDLHIDFQAGDRGLLATPERCAGHAWSSVFTPWTAAHGAGGQPLPVGGAMATSENCMFGFSPGLLAGMDRSQARSHGTFAFSFTRQDGEQKLRGLIAQLPQGLLASVKGLVGSNLCSNGQANAGTCPAASKIGLVDAKAGAGNPFVLEEKGEVFLTEGYKGAPYGLAVKVRAIAGPFRGNMELSPIIVRQAVHVDPKTAQVTAISDPLPIIHHGVPLRVREINVLINRTNFMLNPSNCAPKQISAQFVSDKATAIDATNPFQAAGCDKLRFKPKLALRLTGRKQTRTGRHPGIRAVVTQKGIAEAGIQRAEVRLPKSLALDVDNAQALCEFETGTRPDLENHCPRGSIVGRARAASPLLNRPLTGNVYFVKNVRRSSSGNLIRTLPMIVVALRGEIAINLVGESDVKNGKLVNTFNQVPDAPVNKFNLNINGGKNGIIAVTRTRKGLINLCTKPRSHTAITKLDSHNTKRHNRNTRLKTPCSKKTKRKATAKKRAAKRQANKRAARPNNNNN